MDNYINSFTTETGCQLELEKSPTGIGFKAMSGDGQCVGHRCLSNVQLANGALVQAVMLDFIAQTKRVLEQNSRFTASAHTPPQDAGSASRY